jgi:hypothetical protein
VCRDALGLPRKHNEEEGFRRFLLFTLLRLFTISSVPVHARVEEARRVFGDANILLNFPNGTLFLACTKVEKNRPEFRFVAKIQQW